MRRGERLLKYFRAAPTTALGILIAGPTALTGGTVYVFNGVIEAHGGFAILVLRGLTGAWLKGGAAALTLGHVVIGRDRESLDRTRAHERIHVKQCERWGPFFVPAYLLASVFAWVRGENVYTGNRFEREAFANDKRYLY